MKIIARVYAGSYFINISFSSYVFASYPLLCQILWSSNMYIFYGSGYIYIYIEQMKNWIIEKNRSLFLMIFIENIAKVSYMRSHKTQNSHSFILNLKKELIIIGNKNSIDSNNLKIYCLGIFRRTFFYIHNCPL